MDADHFDALSRVMSTNRSPTSTGSRRQALVATLGVGLAMLGMSSLAEAGRGRKKKKKKKNKPPPCSLLNQPCTGAGDGSCCETALVASAICSAVTGQPGFNTCCVPSGHSPTAPAALCATAPGGAAQVANPACCSGFCSAVSGEFECA